MPQDIAESVYCYLARDWGLAKDELTETKCEQLRTSIPQLRLAYHGNRAIAYHKPTVRRAYLAAFAPRYAYFLYRSLQKVRARALEVLRPWHREEGVMCMLGGGPACEIFGLLDWLYQHDIEPRYLRVVIMDREGYWRSFHSYLFSELVSRHFRKTMVIPSYESVDFPVPTGVKFDRSLVNYNYAQASLLSEARLISIVNCLSEIGDHRGFRCHLHYLTQIAWESQLVFCADSNAKKRRPRMSWLPEFFDENPKLKSKELFEGTIPMKFKWLKRGPTSQRIFRNGSAPTWQNDIQRWAYIRKIG
jgi:hypothetical protein